MRFNKKNYLPIFISIYTKKILNIILLIKIKIWEKNEFLIFLQNTIIKELSVILWNIIVQNTKNFSNDEIKLFKSFHKNTPKVKIHDWFWQNLIFSKYIYMILV